MLRGNLKNKPKMIRTRTMSLISIRMMTIMIMMMMIMMMMTIMMTVMMVTALVTSGSPIVLVRHLSMDWENFVGMRDLMSVYLSFHSHIIKIPKRDMLLFRSLFTGQMTNK